MSSVNLVQKGKCWTSDVMPLTAGSIIVFVRLFFRQKVQGREHFYTWLELLKVTWLTTNCSLISSSWK